MSAAAVLKCLLALSLASLSSGLFAASFDCAAAASHVASVACSDQTISSLDDKLQQAYKTALAATDSAGKKALIVEQRHWIKHERDICAGASCVQAAYASRIALLERDDTYIIDESSCEVPAGSKTCVSVVTYRDPSIRIASFNQSLAEASVMGTVIGCIRLIVGAG